MVQKRIAALLLAMGMVVTATAGCSKTENSTSSGDASTSDTKASENQDNTDVADDEDDKDDGEVADIKVALMSLAPVDTSVSEGILEKVNEITESQINVHVDVQWVEAGSYGTQVTMMIQGGDDLDLMQFTPIPGGSYTSFLSAGQFKQTDFIQYALIKSR